jgi:drug/metabolite transporter (DMT)-like permease
VPQLVEVAAPMPAGSPLAARMLLVLAAVLWSLGSLFMRLLREPTSLGLHEPLLSPVQVAFWRGLFAGVALLPLVRVRDVTVRPLLAGMVGCFAVMSGLYLSALGLGNAANAIFLQNSAPVWVYVVGVYLLGQTADARLLRSTVLAAVGVVVIVAGNWPRGLPADEQSQQVTVLMMATGSGVTYAGVVLFLNYFRRLSPAYLMVLNLVGSAACLGGFVLARYGWAEFATWVTTPTAPQLAFLAVFGAVQMAAPYWLFARGLRTVSAQEAGIITLLEPVLNPVWAYLIAGEVPSGWTVIGGAVLLLALLWRYAPGRKPRKGAR